MSSTPTTFNDEKHGEKVGTDTYDEPSTAAADVVHHHHHSEVARTGAVYEVELEDEEQRTTHRDLKSRHISMIAIGGAIGSGLVIGSGAALAKSGPVGLLIGYAFVGAVCYVVMTALGEMATEFPDKRGFPGYAVRFVDPALGFTCATNYLAKYLITSPNQIIACVVCIQYWDDKRVNPAVYCAVIWVVIAACQLLPVRVFGEVEFVMSTIKVLTLTGLIIFGICIDLGAGDQGRLGFQYWKNPGPFNTYLATGNWGKFLAFWYSVPNALFSYIGTELVGVTVGEAKNPRKAIPRAIKATFARIVIFYIGLIFLVGLLVPYNSPLLKAANASSANANASPFVLAIQLAGIKTLPSILNACILLFVFSAANSDVYVASRTLFQMSCQGQALAIFRKTKGGIPIYAVGLTLAFTTLCFICVSTSALVVFRYFTSLIALFGAISWATLLISHIRWRRAIKVQGFDQSKLSYVAPGGEIASWIALVATLIITIFKGYDSFKPFVYVTFITNYVGLVLTFVSYVGWKLVYRTKITPLAEIDLYSGTRIYEEEEVTDTVEYGPGWKGKMRKYGAKLAG